MKIGTKTDGAIFLRVNFFNILNYFLPWIFVKSLYFPLAEFLLLFSPFAPNWDQISLPFPFPLPLSKLQLHCQNPFLPSFHLPRIRIAILGPPYRSSYCHLFYKGSSEKLRNNFHRGKRFQIHYQAHFSFHWSWGCDSNSPTSIRKASRRVRNGRTEFPCRWSCLEKKGMINNDLNFQCAKSGWVSISLIGRAIKKYTIYRKYIAIFLIDRNGQNYVREETF